MTESVCDSLLGKNKGNRVIRVNRVKEYMHMMLDGFWRVDPSSPICVGIDDVLYNGQHRLTAALESARRGIVVDMYIAWSCPSDIRPIIIIDTGAARRIGDNLQILARDELDALATNANGKTVASLINIIRLIVNDSSTVAQWDSTIEIMEKYKSGLSFVLSHLNQSGPRCKMPVYGAIAYAYKANPNGVMDFAHKYASGVSTGVGDPVGALIDIISNERKNERVRANRKMLAMKTLRSIYAYLNDEPVFQLKKASILSEEYFRKANHD
jgi:hypothetical protein